MNGMGGNTQGSRETNSCVRYRIAFENEKRAEYVRAKINHICGCMRCGLFPYSVAQSILGPGILYSE